jgi:hypothetical protein
MAFSELGEKGECQVNTGCCPNRFIKAGNIELRGAKYETRKSRALVSKA